jgi:GNAT superfamily N-acetyltransferase
MSPSRPITPTDSSAEGIAALRAGVTVDMVDHARLVAYLAAAPVAQLFPLYVCAQRPDGRSYAALRDGCVRGVLVRGASFDVIPVWAAWLVADDEASAAALLERAREEGWCDGLQLPWGYRSLAESACPGFACSEDVYLVREAAPMPGAPSKGALLALDESTLAGLQVPKDVRDSLGSLDDFPPGSPFWGLVVDGRLVAVAETIVRVGQVVTIQLVYTAGEARGQGFGTALIAAVLAHPGLAGCTVTWLASADNEPSIRLAKGVGFIPHLAFGCLAPLPT